MSDESPRRGSLNGRTLRFEEKVLLEAIGDGHIQADLDALLVTDQDDGGMGGIRTLQAQGPTRHIGQSIAEAEYIDSDGIVVSITLNVDQNGNLYELDFWKVDFHPLRSYPRPDQIINVSKDKISRPSVRYR